MDNNEPELKLNENYMEMTTAAETAARTRGYQDDMSAETYQQQTCKVIIV